MGLWNQYFGHVMRRVDSLEKTLMLGGIEGRTRRGDRGWDGWMASLTRWTWIWVNSRNWWWTGRPGVLRFMGSQRVGHDWAAELNRTDGKLDDMQYRWEVSSFHSVVIQRSPISKNIWYFKKFLDFLSLQTLWSCYQVVGTRNLHLTGFPMWYWFSSVFKSY